MNEQSAPQLTFEGVVAFPADDPGEAAHFFEHTLGLAVTAEDGPLRFYTLGEGLALAIDGSGQSGNDPYLLFSAADLAAAAEHFLQRGCQVRELSWAPGAGFLARSPEGRTVCVVDVVALQEAP
ncbi:MAG: hypothetical protein WD359_04065 [Dehalococcoidia bacterium]